MSAFGTNGGAVGAGAHLEPDDWNGGDGLVALSSEIESGVNKEVLLINTSSDSLLTPPASNACLRA